MNIKKELIFRVITTSTRYMDVFSVSVVKKITTIRGKVSKVEEIPLIKTVTITPHISNNDTCV